MSVSSDAEIIRAYFTHCNWPRLYYGVVVFLAKEIEARTILEIGVAFGYHAENILSSLSTVKYYGVDPYKAGYDDNDTHDVSLCEIFREPDAQTAMDRLYRVVKSKLYGYGGRAKLYRESSAEAVRRFEAGYFDLIFIDGNHAYDAVKADLVTWWPKLRPGGTLCGDDYSWPEVKRAVDEFASAAQQVVKFAEKPSANYPIWVIRKPDADSPLASLTRAEGQGQHPGVGPSR